jgi:hypothetical protein
MESVCFGDCAQKPGQEHQMLWVKEVLPQKVVPLKEFLGKGCFGVLQRYFSGTIAGVSKVCQKRGERTKREA